MNSTAPTLPISSALSFYGQISSYKNINKIRTIKERIFSFLKGCANLTFMDDLHQNQYLSLSQQAQARTPRPYLDGLNDAQRSAVETLEGPLLMLAGAGTGKTKALTARIAHLLSLAHAQTHQILAVTFTNKAAREMKFRVSTMLGIDASTLPWMGTFHALSAKILRRHSELVGLKSSFTIFDKDDQIRLLKQLIIAANIDEKRWPARMLAAIIDDWKNRALLPDKVPLSEAAGFNHMGVRLYHEYQSRLRTLNAADFGDLLLHCVSIFQNNSDILEFYQQLFRYILVDEYQDTNVAQYLWLRLLAQKHKNICCVGDDDQSIYGWRGAEVGNILRFESDFPGAKVVRLEQNYRSTGNILAAASGLIAANEGRLGKTLWTAGDNGEKVRLIGHWDGEEEARWVGDEIEALQRGTRGLNPVSLDHQAILVRASSQMRAFEDRFLSIGLPYRVIGGPRFYERLEIRDAMAYFRLTINPSNDMAFDRIINTPKRGVGNKAQSMIRHEARQNDIPLLNATQQLLKNGAFSKKAENQLKIFVSNLDRWKQVTQLIDYNHIALAEQILEESGYTDMWQNDESPDTAERLENLKELIKALEQFDNLQGFLEHVSLITDNENDDSHEKVSIMTLHAAKGLEFPVVFLPGWEDGLFPSQRSLDETGQKGLEEERRLAYVGMTRAKNLCSISFASNRRVYGRWQSQLPSRFIDELPPPNIEVLGASSLYNAPAQTHDIHNECDLVPLPSFYDKASESYNSPGWQRMQAHKASKANTQQDRFTYGAAEKNYAAQKSTIHFCLGDRVFNQKLGYGQIVEIDGEALEVLFEHSGVKKIKAQFVIPAEQAGQSSF